MGQKEFNNQKKETPMKKEYMAPEMEVVEMDYENRLLCESNCDDVPVNNSDPFNPNLPSTTGPLG